MKTESEVLDILESWDKNINDSYKRYISWDLIGDDKLTRDEFEQEYIEDSLDSYVLSYKMSRILKFGVKNEVHNTPFGAVEERKEIKKIIQMHREFPEKKRQKRVNPNYISKSAPKSKNQTHKTKVRFFYAKPCYNTWSKLFVLTEDGKLYSEYLSYYKLTVFEKKVDFNGFKADGFKWGGYQTIEEVDEKTAVNTRLTKQTNWISKYLQSKSL